MTEELTLDDILLPDATPQKDPQQEAETSYIRKFVTSAAVNLWDGFNNLVTSPTIHEGLQRGWRWLGKPPNTPNPYIDSPKTKWDIPNFSEEYQKQTEAKILQRYNDLKQSHETLQQLMPENLRQVAYTPYANYSDFAPLRFLEETGIRSAQNSWNQLTSLGSAMLMKKDPKFAFVAVPTQYFNMVAQEESGVLAQADAAGIPRSFSVPYARTYGLQSGATEFVSELTEALFRLSGAHSIATKKLAPAALDASLKFGLGAGIGGAEGGAQRILELNTLYNMQTAWNELHPDKQVNMNLPKPEELTKDIASNAYAEFQGSLGAGAGMGVVGTTQRVVSNVKAKQKYDNKTAELQQYAEELQKEEAILEGKLAQALSDADVNPQEILKPIKTEQEAEARHVLLRQILGEELHKKFSLEQAQLDTVRGTLAKEQLKARIFFKAESQPFSSPFRRKTQTEIEESAYPKNIQKADIELDFATTDSTLVYGRADNQRFVRLSPEAPHNIVTYTHLFQAKNKLALEAKAPGKPLTKKQTDQYKEAGRMEAFWLLHLAEATRDTQYSPETSIDTVIDDLFTSAQATKADIFVREFLKNNVAIRAELKENTYTTLRPIVEQNIEVISEYLAQALQESNTATTSAQAKTQQDNPLWGGNLQTYVMGMTPLDIAANPDTAVDLLLRGLPHALKDGQPAAPWVAQVLHQIVRERRLRPNEITLAQSKAQKAVSTSWRGSVLPGFTTIKLDAEISLADSLLRFESDQPDVVKHYGVQEYLQNLLELNGDLVLPPAQTGELTYTKLVSQILAATTLSIPSDQLQQQYEKFLALAFPDNEEARRNATPASKSFMELAQGKKPSVSKTITQTLFMFATYFADTKNLALGSAYIYSAFMELQQLTAQELYNTPTSEETLPEYTQLKLIAENADNLTVSPKELDLSMDAVLRALLQVNNTLSPQTGSLLLQFVEDNPAWELPNTLQSNISFRQYLLEFLRYSLNKNVRSEAEYEDFKRVRHKAKLPKTQDQATFEARQLLQLLDVDKYEKFGSSNQLDQDRGLLAYIISFTAGLTDPSDFIFDSIKILGLDFNSPANSGQVTFRDPSVIAIPKTAQDQLKQATLNQKVNADGSITITGDIQVSENHWATTARSLYSDSLDSVLPREFLQNSHDAILRKFTLENIHEGLVQITYRQDAQQLNIVDNGIGMSPEQLLQFPAPGVSFKDMKTSAGGFGAAAIAFFATSDVIQITTRWVDPKTGHLIESTLETTKEQWLQQVSANKPVSVTSNIITDWKQQGLQSGTEIKARYTTEFKTHAKFVSSPADSIRRFFEFFLEAEYPYQVELGILAGSGYSTFHEYVSPKTQAKDLHYIEVDRIPLPENSGHIRILASKSMEPVREGHSISITVASTGFPFFKTFIMQAPLDAQLPTDFIVDVHSNVNPHKNPNLYPFVASRDSLTHKMREEVKNYFQRTYFKNLIERAAQAREKESIRALQVKTKGGYIWLDNDGILSDADLTFITQDYLERCGFDAYLQKLEDFQQQAFELLQKNEHFYAWRYGVSSQILKQAQLVGAGNARTWLGVNGVRAYWKGLESSGSTPYVILLNLMYLTDAAYTTLDISRGLDYSTVTVGSFAEYLQKTQYPAPYQGLSDSEIKELQVRAAELFVTKTFSTLIHEFAHSSDRYRNHSEGLWLAEFQSMIEFFIGTPELQEIKQNLVKDMLETNCKLISHLGVLNDYIDFKRAGEGSTNKSLLDGNGNILSIPKPSTKARTKIHPSQTKTGRRDKRTKAPTKLNPKKRKSSSSIEDILPLEQSNQAGQQGEVTFAEDGKAVLTFFENADMSTGIHELAHVFFNTLSETDIELIVKQINRTTKRAKAFNPTGLQVDLDVILAWQKQFSPEKTLKTAPYTLLPESRKQITLVQEYFARSFEQYLRQGVAPVTSLRTLYTKFSQKLKAIYKRAKDIPGINAVLNPQLRDIFDDMLTKDAKAGRNQIKIIIDGKSYTLNQTRARERRRKVILSHLELAEGELSGYTQELINYAQTLSTKHRETIALMATKIKTRKDLTQMMDKIDKLEARELNYAKKQKIKKFKKIYGDMQLDKIEKVYAKSIRLLLSDISLDSSTQMPKKIQGAKQLQAHIKSVYEETHVMPFLPDKVLAKLKEFDKQSIYDLSVEDIDLLQKSIQHLYHLAQLKIGLTQSRMISQLSTEVQEARNILAPQVNKAHLGQVRGLRSVLEQSKEFFLDRTRHAENLALYMDNFEEDGLFTRIFYDNIDEGTRQAQVIVYNYIDSVRAWKAEIEDMYPGAENKFSTWSSALINPGSKLNSQYLIPVSLQKHSSESKRITKGTLHITKAQRVALWLYNKNVNSTRHLLKGGFIDKRHPTVTWLINNQETLDAILKDITPAEQELGLRILDYYETIAKPLINKVSTSLIGYELADEDNYFPLFVEWLARGQSEALNRAALEKGVERFVRRILERTGALTERVAAENPIYLPDVFEAMQTNVEEYANYVGLAEPLRHAKAILFDAGDDTTKTSGFVQLMKDAWGESNYRALQDYLVSVEGDIHGTVVSSVLGKHILDSMTWTTLGWNIVVATIQPLSYVTAYTEMDSKYLLKALAQKPTSIEELSKLDIELRARFDGGFNKDLSELRAGAAARHAVMGDSTIMEDIRSDDEHSVLELALKAIKYKSFTGIKRTDAKTIGYLHQAVILEQTDLGYTGRELQEQVRKRLAFIIRNTQPIYGVKDRSPIMNSKNFLDNLLTKFYTQLGQHRNEVEKQYRLYKAGKQSGLVTFRKLSSILIVNTVALGMIKDIFATLYLLGDDDEERRRRNIKNRLPILAKLFKALALGAGSLLPGIRDVTYVAANTVERGEYTAKQQQNLVTTVLINAGVGAGQVTTAIAPNSWSKADIEGKRMEVLLEGLMKLSDTANRAVIGLPTRNPVKAIRYFKGLTRLNELWE